MMQKRKITNTKGNAGFASLFFFSVLLLDCIDARSQPLHLWKKDLKAEVFYEPNCERILLELPGKKQCLFLLNQNLALCDGELIRSGAAPIWRDGNVDLTWPFLEPILRKMLNLDDFQSLQKKFASESGSRESCKQVKLIRRVFIDPGHGGTDFGTQQGNVQEKNVVLQFSKQVASELRAQGYEIEFSRRKDVYLPLDVRSKLAKEWNADIFISIHVNSSKHTEVSGTETYILNQDATDAEARKLALLENSVAQIAKDNQSAVQDILWDMEQTAFLQDSAYLASNLHGEIVKSIGKLQELKHWSNRGVREAPFFVLSHAPMPAVLVELGYLSNRADRKTMTEKKFQEQLAKAMAAGVNKYRDACKP